MIRWESISVNTSDDGVLLGYELEVTGNNKTVTFTMPADTSEVMLPHLKRKSNYAITIHGFTQFGDGNILRNNFATLGRFAKYIYNYIATLNCVLYNHTQKKFFAFFNK